MSSADYALVETVPALDDYLHLRAASGLTPKTREQGELALPNSWAAAHVVHVPTGRTVGMGRVLGDGGWYFHVVDMAVLPEHQRQGLGDRILGHLLRVIEEAAPPNPCITLMADPPGRKLYARHGFVESAPTTVGMVLRRRPHDAPA